MSSDPDSSQSEVPFLGSEDEVRIKGKVARQEFQTSPVKGFPTNWKFRLKTRKTQLLEEGDEIGVWVFRLEPYDQTVYVADDNFGRLPISDRMKPRYREALEHILKLSEEDLVEPSTVKLDCISETKGIFTRCLKKDQWDWFTVYSLLGRPPIPEIRKARQTVISLRDAAKNGDSDQLGSDLRSLGESSMMNRFRSFLKEIGEETKNTASPPELKKV